MADETGDPAIRPEIALSWRRAALAGLDPDSVGRPTFADVDASSRLLVASGPVLQGLADLMDGNAFSLMLSDRDTRIVYRWGGDHRFTAVLDAYGVVAGVRIDEGSFGTNAMGTAMETGRSVEIHGSEHYLQPYKVLSCYGAPVRHPLTRRIEGVLNITSIGPRSNPLFGPLVERAARDIQVRLIEGAREVERRLFLAFQEATRLRSTPVAVLGGDVVLANRACIDLLGTADASILRALQPELATHGITARELDLGPTGRVSVTAERIEGTPDGALFHLGERLGPRFVAASASIPTDRSVLVAGESGTGRTRAAWEVVGGAAVVTMDGAVAVAGAERDWAAQLVGLAERHTGAIVIDDVHVLPETLCTVLRRVLASARARIVLTSCPTDDLPPHVAQVVARCVRRIELAPLRERLHELPALLAEMGAAVRPDRSWVLTPRAMKALSAQPWTGNFTELAGLVDELAARLCPGRIDIADLPERYRGSGRATGLGGRERAERVAIIRALSAAGGNKVHAAAQLGISRTTLYRRMQALDVSDAS